MNAQELVSPEPPYWAAFVDGLERVYRELEQSSEDPQDAHMVGWIYGYANLVHRDRVEQRLGPIEPILRACRDHIARHHHSTHWVSLSDLDYIRDRIRAMDLATAKQRLEQWSLVEATEDDGVVPLLLRERAVIARLEEHWSHSANFLREAQVRLDGLVESGVCDQPGWLDLAQSTRLDLAAAWFLLDLERGTPDRLAARMQTYWDVARGRPPGQQAPDRWRWIANGYFLEMRWLHALGDHQGVLDKYAQSLTDEVLVARREEHPQAYALVRLDARAAMERAILSETEGGPAARRMALGKLIEVRVRTPADSHEAVWLDHRLASMHNDLGQPEQALAVITKCEESLAGKPRFKELRQAFAVQRARALLAGAGQAALLPLCLSQLQTEWDTLLDDWAAEERHREGTGVLWFSEQRDLVEALFRVHSTLSEEPQASRRCLEEWMRFQAQGTLALELGASEIDLAQARRSLLKTDLGALVYFPGHYALHIFVIDAGFLKRVEVPLHQAELERRIERFQLAIEAVRRHPSDAREVELQAARQSLSEVLLPQEVLTAMAAWKGVRVIGLEAAGYVPFEYLLDEEGAALGLERRVSYAPSLQLAAFLEERSPSAIPREQVRVTALACPAPGSSGQLGNQLDALRWGPREESWFLTGLPREGLTWIPPEGASRSNLEAAHLEHSQALHLLAHGLPRASGGALLLAGGEVFSGSHLEMLSLPPLVAIDACAADAASLRRGDDGRHRLFGSAILAGSCALTLPVFDIEYGVALQLRARVQRAQFVEGLALDEAWRVARKDLAQTPPMGVHEVEYFLQHVHGAGSLRLCIPSTPGLSNWISGAIVFAIALAVGVGLSLRRRAVG